jgi:hypothetical protein
MASSSTSIPDLAHRLSRVGMTDDPVLARDVGDLGDGFERADLVVGVHDANQHRPGFDRPAHVLGVHRPEAVDGQDGQPVAPAASEVVAGLVARIVDPMAPNLAALRRVSSNADRA